MTEVEVLGPAAAMNFNMKRKVDQTRNWDNPVLLKRIHHSYLSRYDACKGIRAHGVRIQAVVLFLRPLQMQRFSAPNGVNQL